MAQANAVQPELANLVGILAEKLGASSQIAKYLYLWENVIFSLIIVGIISLLAFLASRKTKLYPKGCRMFVSR